MGYIGKTPTAVPLSVSDLDDDIISLAKMASGTDGNIITYDASGDPVAVATGNDGQVLTSAGAGQPCAFEAAAGGGKIGQIVQTLKTDVFTTNSTTAAAVTGLSVAITPTAADSKVLVQVCLGSCGSRNGHNKAYVTIVGGNAATYIGDADTGHECAICVVSNGGDDYAQTTGHAMYLDSPATDSEVTYQAYIWGNIVNNVTVNQSNTLAADSGNTASTIIAMEVLA